MVPATTAGTQWELDCLANDEVLGQKTLIIVPPKTVHSSGSPMRSIHSDRARADAIAALKLRGISLREEETEQGLLMPYLLRKDTLQIMDYLLGKGTSQKINPAYFTAPLVTYVTPRSQRGFLGWYLNSGWVQEEGKVLGLGLRNAILEVKPTIADPEDKEGERIFEEAKAALEHLSKPN